MNSAPTLKKSNKLTKKKILAVILAPLMVAGALVGSFALTQTASANGTPASYILNSTNSYRADAGLQPMQLDQSMSANAQAWAEYMAETDDYSHNPNFTAGTPAGTVLWGENIAAGWGSNYYLETPAAWYNSPDHQANMLRDSFNLMGVGFAVGESGHAYAVQQFASHNYAPPVLPEAPSIPTVSSNGDGTATVSWAYNGTGSSPLTYTEVEHSVNGNYVNTYDAGTATTLTVPSSPGTVNTFAVQTHTSVGASGWSPVGTHNEPATVPQNVTFDVTALTSRTATVWASTASDGGSAITNYTLSLGGDTLTSPDGAFSLTDLQRNTTHTGTLTASNSVGTSTATDVSFTTFAELPTAPQSVTATVSNGSDITASWGTPTDSGGASLDSYTYTVVDTTTGETVSTDTTASRTVTVPALKGHSYSVSVTANNTAGASPASTATLTVPQTVPSQPSTPTAVLTDLTSIVLAWEQPADDGGTPATSHTVKGYADGESKPAVTVKVSGDTLTHVFTELDGLKEGTSYRFTVSTRNIEGISKESVKSEPVLTGTVEKPQPEPETPEEEPVKSLPAPVSNLKAVPGDSETGNTVSVSWNAPAEDAEVIAYKIDGHSEDGTLIVSETVPTSQLNTNLSFPDPGTTYNISVVAVNEYGASEPTQTSATTSVIRPSKSRSLTAVPDLINGTAGLSIAWEEPAEDGGADIQNYSITAINTEDESDTQKLETSDTSATVWNLSPVTEYRIVVEASNSELKSEPAEITIRTSTARTGTPTNTEITIDDDRNATVSWAEPNDGTPSNTVGVKKYVVSLFNEDMQLISPPKPFNLIDWFTGLFTSDEAEPTETEKTEIRWDGMPEGSYYIHIVAVNNAGIPSSAAEKAFQVEAAPAEEPIEEEEESQPPVEEPTEEEDNTIPTEEPTEEGTPKEDESGEEETPPTTETPEPEKETAPPASPSDLKAVKEDINGVKVSWTAPANTNITGYVITQSLNGSDVKREVSSEVLSQTYTGLSSGGKYVFTVKSVNTLGESEPVKISYTAPVLVEPLPTNEEKPESGDDSQEEPSPPELTIETPAEPTESTSQLPSDSPQATTDESVDSTDVEAVKTPQMEEAEALQLQKTVEASLPPVDIIDASLLEKDESFINEDNYLMLILLGVLGALMLGGAIVIIAAKTKPRKQAL